MTMFRRLSARSLFTVAVMALAFAVTASTARAAVITFQVDEDQVDGADAQIVDANGITGKYQENLLLDSPAAGDFTAFLVVEFTAYTNVTPTTDQLGAFVPGGETSDTNLYTLYALVTVTGTYSSTVGGFSTQIEFEPETSTAAIWVDPLRDTTTNYLNATQTGGTVDDELVLTASLLDEDQSLGLVVIQNSNNAVLGGFYALLYTNPTLTAFGQLYWPDLELLGLAFAIASGDVDPTSEGSQFPGDIRGDTSIAFLDSQPIPEPASLMLLGTGLLGLVARRRRNAA